METAISDVRRFRMAFRVAEERASALDRLIEILSAHRVAGRQVHDANIVATMIDCRVQRLLTFNGTDFQRFVPLIEIDRLPLGRPHGGVRGRPSADDCAAIRPTRHIPRGF